MLKKCFLLTTQIKMVAVQTNLRGNDIKRRHPTGCLIFLVEQPRAGRVLIWTDNDKTNNNLNVVALRKM